MRRFRALVFVVAALPVLLSGCFWGQPGYNAKGGGYNPSETTITAANASSLVEQWTATLDNTSASPPISIVESADGLVHVNDGQAVYGLRSGTGERVWRTPMAGIGISELSAGTNDLDVATANDSDTPYLNLHRLDATTGADLGTTPLGDSVIGGPDFHGDALATVRSGPWAVTTGTELGFQQGLPGLTATAAVVAVTNSTDPSKSWSAQYGGGTAVSQPIIVGQRAYAVMGHTGINTQVVVSDQELLGWDLDTPCPQPGCQPQLEVPLGEPSGVWAPDQAPAASPDGSTIFVPDAGAVVAVDVASGTVAWTGGTPDTTSGFAEGGTVPTVTPQGVFVGTSSSLELFPLNGCGATTCSPIWSSQPISVTPFSRVAAAADIVVVTDSSGLKVFPAACTDGCAPLWTANVGTIVSDPIIGNGKILVVTSDGVVHAFGLPAPGG